MVNKELVFELVKGAIPLAKEVTKMYGVVHRRTTAEINGVKGFLIWDFMVYNEITFQDMNGNIYSCFNSFSDIKTEEEWDRLVNKYGT